MSRPAAGTARPHREHARLDGHTGKGAVPDPGTTAGIGDHPPVAGYNADTQYGSTVIHPLPRAPLSWPEEDSARVYQEST